MKFSDEQFNRETHIHFDDFSEEDFGRKFAETAGKSFDPLAAEKKVTEAKASVVDTTGQFLKLIINTPGALLIKLGFLATVSVLSLSALGIWRFDSAWWKISLALGILALVFVLGFAWRRKDLLRRISAENAKIIAAGGTQVIISSGSKDDTSADFKIFAQQQGESIASVRAEFNTRSAKFMPRVEASQRALRELAGGAYQGSWLEHDLRPTLVFFIGAFLSMPVMIFVTLLSIFLLIFGG
ncbi:hypothetical protein NXS08_01530 [Gleimia sp. 6138-11-ORH1]|uniref:hypothetical protein n=1 Tax=Gleimia sp. 6138-11-ORH1 TaxID=2973937 RepID=UPI002168689A|nr:hypothetical protein [Gleimia sp. 6138-11-ORH1]MCS4484173.1 hypothetical protein [Gleimia sp. 6138-11-ORH1]